MLASGVTISGNLFVVGGITKSIEKPKALADIFVLDESSQSWRIWTTMSHTRLNHCTTQYDNFLIVTGGHTL